MKEFDFTQIKHYKLYNFIKAVFRPLVKLVFKAKFNKKMCPKTRALNT